MVENSANVIPVGGVAGIYDVTHDAVGRILGELGDRDVHERLVPYANLMHRVEINQLNTLLSEIVGDSDERSA